ncbi:MAG: DUF2101 family protein [Methanobacterium sp.]|nr:DUF2101 family protein [Methanobacterium sp.]
MGIFSKIGDAILGFFSLLGSVILAIPQIPQKLRNIDRNRVKEKIVSENLKKNVSQEKDNLRIDEKTPHSTSNDYGKIKSKETPATDKEDSDVILISAPFTSKEKEDTIFRLQILSAGFLILSVLTLLSFIPTVLYAIISILLVGFILYTLFNRVKVMYGPEFPAYRDFFLMYIAVGIVLVLVGTNPTLIITFSWSYFPSLTILIFSMIAVAVVYLVFRIRYHRDFTYGVVVETGEKMAYVKVEYDIRSNVKPDIYIVDNSYGASSGNLVKLKTENKVLSNSGNKPISIIETVNKI